MSDLHQLEKQKWRQPAGVASWWEGAEVPAPLLRFRKTDDWSALLADLGITLIVSREYENFLVAVTSDDGECQQSHLPLPHPSGLAYDADKQTLYSACTRNPNQIVTLRPVQGTWQRSDQVAPVIPGALLPSGRFLRVPTGFFLESVGGFHLVFVLWHL